MKTYFLFFFFFSAILYSQKTKEIKYFDKEYKQISKNKYFRQTEGVNWLGVIGDSVNHRLVVERWKSGNIKNKRELDSLMELAIENKIDSSKILTIIYHPGIDPCNSSGSATAISVKKWHDELTEKLLKITKSEPIYIFKNNSGLLRNRFLLPWFRDPNRIVEKLFFKYHYPCSSFVVISPNGDYISYFGEFPKHYVWEAAKRLAKKNR